MKSYPIMLDLRGRLAVVVGGGPVGLRKVRSLLEAGAIVKLVATDLAADEQDLKRQGVTVLAKPYCAEFLDGALLVFACTDDRALNAQIAQDAHWVGAIVNAADQADACDFFLPAVASDGEVVIAVGTGGSAPALAGILRDRLHQALPHKAGAFAAALAKVREELKEKFHDHRLRGDILKLLTARAYDVFDQEGEPGLRKCLETILRTDAACRPHDAPAENDPT